MRGQCLIGIFGLIVLCLAEPAQAGSDKKAAGTQASSADRQEASADKPEAATRKLDAKLLRELRLEHSRSRDALLAAEARLGLLAEKLYDCRLEVTYRGDLDSPFSLARIELFLDGGLAYAKDFSRAPSVQLLKLFDAYLPEGRHRMELKVFARGPQDDERSPPGYMAGSGLIVMLKKGSTGKLEFEAEQDGAAPIMSDAEPEAEWDVEIEARFRTEAKARD